MKRNISVVIAVVAFAFILYNYFTNLKDDYYIDVDDDLVIVSTDGEIPSRQVLPQAWSNTIREKFWYTSQGSEIMPYDWFTWLEQADNSKLFRNSKFIEKLGYLPQKESKLNPSGLPIGFTITRARKNKPRGMGFNCAACHTNQLNYQGKQFLIEGAPTLANFVMFYNEIVKSLNATYSNNEKFERFAQKVLKNDYSETTKQNLREALQTLAIAATQRKLVNDLPKDYPKDFTSYARLDAFGNIANAGSAFALHDPSNKNAPTGPVSYPFLWGTHQSDVVQWNASAPNTPVVGPLVRNVGEVVGVFGGLSITEAPWWQQLLGIKLQYSSTVDFRGLGELESWVKELRSPAWPETVFPSIDIEKAARGEALFRNYCISCHQVIPRENEGNLYVANQTLISKLGTDPITAWNIQNHQAKTLVLEGTKKDIVLGEQFSAESQSIEIPINGVVGVVLKRPIKALEGGLIPTKSASASQNENNLEELVEEYIQSKNTLAQKHNDTTNKKKIPNALGATAAPMDLDSLVYKGRPLNGIWATAPYLHNGSVPNLWELLKKPEERVKEFYVGNREFDPVNVGYHTSEGPSLFKVLKSNGQIMPGNSNLGHAFGTRLLEAQKWDLIEYMKSL